MYGRLLLKIADLIHWFWVYIPLVYTVLNLGVYLHYTKLTDLDSYLAL